MILSVLDQTLVSSGSSVEQAFANTVALARSVESLGYHRFWIGEHHGSGVFACTAPEVMIAAVAGATSTLRVGSGGVLLSNYSPFKIAEVFRCLEAMYPGRIDLGLGRAPGGSDLMANALADGAPTGKESFSRQIRDLIAELTGATPVSEQYAELRPQPVVDSVPAIWGLASGDGGARSAGQLGLPLGFAHFFNPDTGPDVARLYRETFEPSRFAKSPTVALSVYVTCAETQEQVDRLIRVNDLFALRVVKGQHIPLPSVEEAAAYTFSAEEQAIVGQVRNRLIAGTPDQVKVELQAMAEAFGADELVVSALIHDHDERRSPTRR
ncbi:MAG: LLM class flavin-dependent oxidoreductase [Myxococcota bacterium]